MPAKHLPYFTYFQWPWDGPVYAARLPKNNIGVFMYVKLPSRDSVGVCIPKEGSFPIVYECPTSTEGDFIAQVAIEADEFQQRFEGDWEPIISMINICAAVNTLFTVILTHEEYERLKNGGFDDLKKRFSERVNNLLYLCEEGFSAEEPTLELCRHCSGCH